MLSLLLSFFFVYCIGAVVSPYLQVMIHNLGYSYKVVGSLLSLYEVAAIVGPLLVALWIDRSGRMKGSVLLCSLLSMGGMALLMFSRSIPSTAFALSLYALTYRSIIPAMDSYANNRFDGNAGLYSLVRSVGTFGFILLSLFFALSKQPDLKSNVAIGSWALGSTSIFLVLVLGWKDEPKHAPLVVIGEPAGGPWYDRAFVVGMLVIALNRFSLSAVASFFSLFLVDELGINAISLMNAIGAGSEFLIMIVAGILLQRKRVLPYHLFVASALAMVVRLLIYALFPTFGGILVAQLLHSISYGAFHPAAIFFVARRVRRHRRTLGMSIYASLGTGLPTVVGTLLGGVIVQHCGYTALFLSYAGVAALSLVVTMLFSSTLRHSPLEEV